MKILITGGKGQLGTELAEILATGKSETGEIPAVYSGAEIVPVDMDELDVSDAAAVVAFAEKTKANPFDLVVHCAAMTNVDACESDKKAALRGNALAARNIAALAQLHGAKLVCISTDYVFSGTADTPYSEWDLPAPVTAYGKSKLLGERYAAEVCSKLFIVRTAWLYGKRGNNFVRTMLKLFSEQSEIKVVNDQIGNPTNANDLAHHILKIAAGEDYGIYHVTGGGICSWFEFASEIARLVNASCKIVPCSTDEFPRPAKRPAYSALEHLSLRATVGDEMRSWQDALASYILQIC